MKQAEERTWETVRRAYQERQPQPQSVARPVAAVVLLAALVGAAVLSPPGRAVFHQLRRAVGVEDAAPALFSLPADGRLIVVSGEPGGVWIVSRDGLKRRLGRFENAAWSPHGLYLVATSPDELAAVGPRGAVRWSLARRGVRDPSWEGTRSDTRIAYLADGGLRIVAGDGTGDRLVDAAADNVPPAWDPARLHVLAYVARGKVVLRTAGGRIAWRVPAGASPVRLAWSSDGRDLAVLSRRRVTVLGADGRTRRTVSLLRGRPARAAFRPASHQVAVSLRLAGRSEVRLVDVDRPGTSKLLFAGPGVFGDLAWSPDGRWLLVDWPTADQWLFLHGAHVRAVANIRRQFPGGSRPARPLELSDRWCCQ